MTYEEWGLFMWSDECSVERGRGKNQEWCFRTPDQKWEREMIQTYNAHKNMSVMVWGCFWDYGRSDLYVMDRDFESKKHGYSARSYLEVLNAQVAPWYEELDDDAYVFMQDNAPIHNAYVVRDWFIAHGIRRIDWPPYSPDLNPIEHIWWVLKKLLIEMYPELSASFGKSDQDREDMEEALKECWAAIPKETFDKLYISMGHRIEACIAADGWHTKY
jgi:transposase